MRTDACERRGSEEPRRALPRSRLDAGSNRPRAHQIVGHDRVDALYDAAPDDEQHIHRFLSANCFGDHLTRGGIDIPTRELLTFAMLVALGGCDPQVKDRVAANLNVDNDRSQLIEVLTQLIPFIGYPRTLNGLRAVDDARPA